MVHPGSSVQFFTGKRRYMSNTTATEDQPESKVGRWTRAKEWFAERMPIRWETFHALAAEPIPKHLHKFWFCLGGTPLIFLCIQIVTGICLVFFYIPHPDQAYNSIEYIQKDVAFGWWVRGLHKWSSHLMIIAVMLHMVRVFFTDSYRRPRELNWVAGALLLGITLGFAFTGYALVYDQLSYWATKVGTEIAGTVPFIGQTIMILMRGGLDITPNTLTRMFVFHVGVMPVLMMFVLAVHLILLRVHGINPMHEGKGPEPKPHQPDGSINRKHFYPFMPDHLLTELAIALVACIALTILAVKLPAALGYQADPNATPEHIKPEWFFYAVFRWLKMIQFNFILSAKQIGVISAGIVYFVILIWPFIEQPFLKKPKLVFFSKVVGLVFIAMFIFLTFYEATH